MSLITTISGISAAALYLAATTTQYKAMKKNKSQKHLVVALGLFALALHLIMVFFSINTAAGIDLSFFKVGSLIALPIVMLTIFSALKKPIENLFIGIFPISAIVILSAVLIPSTAQPHTNLAPLIATHIILSIMAYSVITIAAVHALLVLIQDKQLKTRKTNGIVRSLPALQTMDRVLFEIVWSGIILLTGALVTGCIYMFEHNEEHLYHKITFSLISWIVFATLLVGRYIKGWRGAMAGRFTLAGFVFLMLSYFGSKLVLELVLNVG
jgi:ABC-type uncharacterized transport system permease subunit